VTFTRVKIKLSDTREIETETVAAKIEIGTGVHTETGIVIEIEIGTTETETGIVTEAGTTLIEIGTVVTEMSSMIDTTTKTDIIRAKGDRHHMTVDATPSGVAKYYCYCRTISSMKAILKDSNPILSRICCYVLYYIVYTFLNGIDDASNQILIEMC